MLQPRLEKIIKEIAKEFGKHPNLIEAVLRSQLNVTHETIKTVDCLDESTWKNIRFKYLGTMKYNARMLKKIAEKIKEKECKQQNSIEGSESSNK